MQNINLTDHFLIAMPALEDPYFSRALIYIAEHNEQGALGVIVNRPIEMSLAALLEKIDLSLESPDAPRLAGLPAQTIDQPDQSFRTSIKGRQRPRWKQTSLYWITRASTHKVSYTNA